MTAAPTAATAMATASAAVPAAPATTAAAALCLGTCFIHTSSSAEILNRSGSSPRDPHLRHWSLLRRRNRATVRKPIANQIDAEGVTPILREPLVELVFRRGKRKITDIELLHLLLLLPGT